MRGTDDLASRAGAFQYLFSLGGGLNMGDRIPRQDSIRFGFSHLSEGRPVRG